MKFLSSEEKDWAAIWPKIRYRHEGQCATSPGSIRLSELETDLRGRKGKGAILQQAHAIRNGNILSSSTVRPMSGFCW